LEPILLSLTVSEIFNVECNAMVDMTLIRSLNKGQGHSFLVPIDFYPRDAMLARVIEIATCPSVCPSVRLSRAGIVSKRRKLAA